MVTVMLCFRWTCGSWTCHCCVSCGHCMKPFKNTRWSCRTGTPRQTLSVPSGRGCPAEWAPSPASTTTVTGTTRTTTCSLNQTTIWQTPYTAARPASFSRSTSWRRELMQSSDGKHMMTLPSPTWWFRYRHTVVCSAVSVCDRMYSAWICQECSVLKTCKTC